MKNEVEIISKGNTYRPDRLMFDDQKVIIVDYKTGQPEDKHKIQLNRYGDLLRQMGFQVIARYLLYLGEKTSVVRF